MKKAVKILAVFFVAIFTVLMSGISVLADGNAETCNCIGISAPYKYSDYDNVSFTVFFDKKITDANYKHLAASASVLKTMSAWDNPNMNEAIIDELDKSGVIDSMNDCIAINGKKVREWQKTSQLALMILVGELGENYQMNIDFNGAIDEVKIEDLNQPFEIILYKGLKFPSGVELARTQIWKFDTEKRAFFEKKGNSDNGNANFTAYYNGNLLKNDFNGFDVPNGRFLLDNVSVYTENPDALVKVEPQFKKLTNGDNYIYVTVTAPDGVSQKTAQILLNNTYKRSNTKKQIVVRWIKLSAAAVLLGFCAVMIIVIIKRSKRSEKADS